LKKDLPSDSELIKSLFNTFEQTNADFTNSFRCLSQISMKPKSSEFPEEALELLCKYSGNLKDALNSARPSLNRAQIDSLKLLQKQSPETFKMLTRGEEGVIEVFSSPYILVCLPSD